MIDPLQFYKGLADETRLKSLMGALDLFRKILHTPLESKLHKAFGGVINFYATILMRHI